MKRVFKSLSLLVLAATVVVSCKKQDVTPNVDETDVSVSKLTTVTHNYTYGDEHYAVVYTLDEANEIVRTGGDTELHKELIERNGTPENVAFLVEDVSEDGLTFDISIFNSNEEMNEFAQVDESASLDLREPCTNYTSGSSSSIFKFYQHSNYVSEYTFLRRAFNSYFQQQWLHSANDNLSSVEIINGGRVTLFDGSCYSGMSTSFQHSVSNLHYIHVGFFWFTPIYAGDFAASIKGYSF
ncbi:MAG: hypothetical protein MK066_14410 [Crocinitomicaceae bacterium]|nr:hypothetical protein [Crocinitomicaceae bacterium]